jgi:alkylation response protein AidB-like acyl-CoA dehydrogenase
MSSPDERADLRDAAARLLADLSPVSSVAAVAEGPDGYDLALWARLAEYGFLGLLVPEHLGGSGGQLSDVAVLAQEMGRVLLPGPFVSSAVTATTALVRAAQAGHGTGLGTSAGLLEQLAAGEQTAVVIDARSVSHGLTVTGDPERGYRIRGTAENVVGADSAGTLLIGAGAREGTALLAVPSCSTERTTVRLADATRRAATVHFDGTQVPAPSVLVSGDAAYAALREAQRYEFAALAADSLGGAQATLALATEYAKTRVQFGRPIGSFQAIKHKLATMYITVESAAAIAERAAAVLDEEPDGQRRDQVATAAGSYCSAAYRTVAGDSIQAHGGIGFTWEHPCHRYLKRAWLNQTIMGGPRVLAARFAAQLFDEGDSGTTAAELTATVS